MMNKVEMNDTMMEQVNGGSIGTALTSGTWKIANWIFDADTWANAIGEDAKEKALNTTADTIDSAVETAENTVNTCLTIFKSWF